VSAVQVERALAHRGNERAFFAIAFLALMVRAKLGKSFRWPPLTCKQKGPVSRAFPVAGAGFEPATSGL
jgi:hypothetical protein